MALNMLAIYQSSTIESILPFDDSNRPFDGSPPIADIGQDQRISEGGTAYLDASESYDTDGQIVRYDYDFGDGSTLTFEPDIVGNKEVLVYTTADTDRDNYIAKVFDEDLPRILGDHGYSVTVTDRYTNPIIDTTLLDDYGQFWIINGDYDYQGDLSASEVQTVLDYASAGSGLYIIADHETNTVSAIHDVNQISTLLGVEYWGMFDQGPQGHEIYAHFEDHPVFENVESLCGHSSSAHLRVTDATNVEVISTHKNENMIASRDDEEGRILFDNTLVRYFDDEVEIPGLHWILVGDTPQYVRNVADWLSRSEAEKPPIVEHQYGDDGHGNDGVYTVTLTVTDDAGLTGSDSIVVTVDNVDPGISVYGPQPVDESSVFAVTSLATDPGSDDLTFTFDWGDGSPDTVLTDLNDPLIGQDPYPSPQMNPRYVTKSASHDYGDNGVYTVTITVTDDDGGEATGSVEIEVRNVPPSVSVSEPLDGFEGKEVALVVTASDQGSDDVFLDLSWGDGSSETRTYYNDGVGPDPPQSPLGNYPFNVVETFSHVYGDNGVYSVVVTASDDDLGEIKKTVNIVVSNIAPTLAPFGSFVVDESSLLAISATATDDGSDDLIFQWFWELGPSQLHTYYNDGVGPDPYPSPGGLFPFSATDTTSHTYGDDGNFTIVLSVTDDDGGAATYRTYVLVENVAPSVLSINYTIFVNAQRTIGYWGHQCVVEHPYGDHTGILSNWIEEISSQSRVFSGISTKEEVCSIVQDGDAREMVIMAKKQLMGLWLNLVSGKLDPTTEVYMPSLTSSATIWEATQEIEDVILSSSDRDELERAKNIADNANNGIGIAKAYGEFTATATDPGSDDLTFSWNFGDGSPLLTKTYYNNAPVNTPDPYPSPEINPIHIADFASHWFATEGPYVIELVVEDDDGGQVATTVSIET